MPKGETSRPNNRDVKQSVNRDKSRMELYGKALKNGAKNYVAKNRILKTKGAEKDSKTQVKDKMKGHIRDIQNSIGKTTLRQSKESTQRERTTAKPLKMKSGSINTGIQKMKGRK